MDIDISGLDKAEVLAALHNGTRAIGLGVMHDIGTDMGAVTAQGIIDGMGANLYFDYVYGRPLKVNLTGDTLDPRLYDRDAGEGACARVITALRERLATT